MKRVGTSFLILKKDGEQSDRILIVLNLGLLPTCVVFEQSGPKSGHLSPRDQPSINTGAVSAEWNVPVLIREEQTWSGMSPLKGM